MKEIGKLSDLRSLDVSGVPVGAAGLSHLKELRKLKRLVLSGAKIDAKAAVQLGGFVNLEELRLYECQITDELIERLKRLRKLRALSLHSCDGLGANGISRIGMLSRLDSLNLCATKGVEADAAFLHDMVQLRKLGLTAVATDAVLRQAKSLRELRELSVSLSEVDDAGFKDIAEMMNLEFLAADGTKITDAALKEIRGLTHLTYLSLADTAVTDEGIKNLYGMKELRMVILPSAKTTDDAVKRLQCQLPKCKVIRGKSGSPLIAGRGDSVRG